MTVTWVDVRHNERAGQRSLPLDMASRESVAIFSRQTWPSNTAKHVAREWGLSLDEARGVVAGRASQATIDKIFKHPNGGWRVVLPVLGAVIGHGIDAFFRQQMKLAAEEARRAEEHECLAREAYRRLEADPSTSGPTRHPAPAVGEAWDGAGEVGDAAAGGLAGLTAKAGRTGR